MKIDIFRILGVGFPPEKANEVREADTALHDDFLTRPEYSEEILRLFITSYIYEKEHYFYVPKPRFAKAKTRISTIRGWPDLHFPPSVEIRVFVDMDVVRHATGTALRHALIDPVCVRLLDTPKTVQKRIDIAGLIADLSSWADEALPEH